MSTINQATESEIRQAIAESGQIKVSQIMKYLKIQMTKPYDAKLARKNAKELVEQMKGYC